MKKASIPYVKVSNKGWFCIACKISNHTVVNVQ